MTHVLDPFTHLFVIVYLDDICIYSKTPKEHLDNLRKVLPTFQEHNFLLKWLNVFGLSEKPNILALIVVASGIVRTSPSKVAAVKEWPLPE